MTELAMLIGVGGAAVLAWWLRRRATDPEPDLTRACRGDAAQASRLIDNQLRRHPNLTRRQAAARALDLLRYENR